MVDRDKYIKFRETTPSATERLLVDILLVLADIYDEILRLNPGPADHLELIPKKQQPN